MRDLGSSDDQSGEKMIVREEYKAQNDPFIFRVSILTLAGTSVIGLITISALAIMSLDVPQALTALTSGGLGALIALFSRK